MTIRALLFELLGSDREVEVIGQADNGLTAITLCEQLRPDVITMDMVMPTMGGLRATEYIMAHCPTPILVVSSSVNRGELLDTYQALAAGALDVMEKPSGDELNETWRTEFLSRVKLISRIRVISHLRARRDLIQPNDGLHSQVLPSELQSPLPSVQHQLGQYQIVAIGASTGGPSAIAQLLQGLPSSLKLPIVIVLHISATFGSAFAQWLDDQTDRKVCLASDNQLIHGMEGKVIVAPPNAHLEVRDGLFHLTDGPERNSCRPSIDILFESLALEYGAGVIACILTGMGRDGAAGLATIRRLGGLTIAQDEETSVVYGMPREALELGGVDLVLPLGEIGPRLSAIAGSDGLDKFNG